MNVAGSNGTAVFGGDEGPALSALLSALNGVGLTSTGDFYIADTANHVVRKVSTFMVLLIS